MGSIPRFSLRNRTWGGWENVWARINWFLIKKTQFELTGI